MEVLEYIQGYRTNMRTNGVRNVPLLLKITQIRILRISNICLVLEYQFESFSFKFWFISMQTGCTRVQLIKSLGYLCPCLLQLYSCSMHASMSSFVSSAQRRARGGRV